MEKQPFVATQALNSILLSPKSSLYMLFKTLKKNIYLAKERHLARGCNYSYLSPDFLLIRRRMDILASHRLFSMKIMIDSWWHRQHKQYSKVL